MTDLRTRLTALLRRLGTTRDATSLGDDLFAAWSEPARRYHDVRHLKDCLTQLDQVALTAGTRDIIELALWFHDAVYDPRAPDNEERSARWALEALPATGMPAAATQEVARLVRLTRDHGPTPDDAGRLMCDIDLAILGRPVEVFDAYERRIRDEYAWVPEATFRDRRIQLLQELLRREPLFQTEPFRRRLESRARANLRRSLAALSGER